VVLNFKTKQFKPTYIQFDIRCIDEGYVLPSSLTITFKNSSGVTESYVGGSNGDQTTVSATCALVTIIGKITVVISNVECQPVELLVLPDVSQELIVSFPSITSGPRSGNDPPPQELDDYELSFLVSNCTVDLKNSLSLKLISSSEPPIFSEKFASLFKIESIVFNRVTKTDGLVTVKLTLKQSVDKIKPISVLQNGGLICLLVALDGIYFSSVQVFCGMLYYHLSQYNILTLKQVGQPIVFKKPGLRVHDDFKNKFHKNTEDLFKPITNVNLLKYTSQTDKYKSQYKDLEYLIEEWMSMYKESFDMKKQQEIQYSAKASKDLNLRDIMRQEWDDQFATDYTDGLLLLTNLLIASSRINSIVYIMNSFGGSDTVMPYLPTLKEMNSYLASHREKFSSEMNILLKLFDASVTVQEVSQLRKASSSVAQCLLVLRHSQLSPDVWSAIANLF
jgi:hypothetical protein